LQSKVFVLEQKIAGLEKQLAELRGKIGTPGPDPALLQRVDALTQKVEALEKQKLPAGESKAKPSAAPKPAAPTEKKYHTVQKGETLYGISKKYGIGVEELRKLNNLSAGQSLRTGQKLVVSPGR
jgi:membrane-bound lytic murein transglycosylase D